MKNKYKDIAEKTLRIIRSGEYELEGQQVNVREAIGDCVFDTKTWSPDMLDKLKELAFENRAGEVAIRVENCSTIESILQNNDGMKTAVLNFASAKNPGGGFMGGAVAQEESLARSSSLYASQTKDTTLYNYNKKQSSFLYSDYMIYSPQVVFWMKDDGTFLNPPVLVDVITAPAPNKGAMLQHARRSEIAEIGSVFMNRIDKLLALAAHKGVERLILGAWGCGVFRNEYKDVAGYFAEVIEKKYRHCFAEIVFAIYDRSKTGEGLAAFRETFETKLKIQ